MLKRYTFWLSAAVIFQFLTAAFHAVSLFVRSEPTNDSERQMFELMTNYRMDAGVGFHPTFSNLMTALSSCFSFVCMLGGLTLSYLMIKHTEQNIMKGMIGINVIIFGAIFVVMAVFTFLPPIVCTGLIFFNLLVAYIVIPRIESVV